METLNFNNVYTSYHSDVLKMVTYKLGQKNKELAEELTNDVFIKANKHIEAYDHEQSTVKTWLFHIANNLITDQWRRKELNALSIEAQLDDEGNEMLQLESTSMTPHDILVNEDLGTKLTGAINSLPDGYRDLSVEFFVNQCSYEEVVDKLELPLNTVKGKLFRARKLLQAALS